MTMIAWKCPNCWTRYEIDQKYEKVLAQKKDCKFCVRKYPDIPTTAEMDGLLTVEDMRIRHDVVFQCMNCNKWTRHSNWKQGEINAHKPCSNCGEIYYDPTSIKSWRTYNPDTDNKKRPSARLKRK